MNKQIEKMSCKKCLHYEDCLKRFRNAKADGEYEFTDENEYFAHAEDCDMFIKGYRYDDLIAKMTEEVDGWKKHFESLYETAKATIKQKITSEIISEIEQAIVAHGTKYALKRLEEIKKKYGVEEDE